MADLKIVLAGIEFANPTILASGIMGSTKASLRKVVEAGAGAVTIKSITAEPRLGHRNPQMVEVEGGFLNAVGYTNMGLDNAKIEFAGASSVGAPVFASIVAEDAQGFARLAGEFSSMEFSALEVVLSCPHTPGVGAMAGHNTPEATSDITKAVKKASKLPVIVKLSPNSQNIGDIAKAAVKSGAAVLNMGNTLGPGMVINTQAGKPVLGFKIGGMSGPILKPIALRCVWDVYESTRGKVPVIGTGGVRSGEDAIQMLMAGASAVGVGTGVYYRGLEVFSSICDEMKKHMVRSGATKVKDLVGVAHE